MTSEQAYWFSFGFISSMGLAVYFFVLWLQEIERRKKPTFPISCKCCKMWRPTGGGIGVCENPFSPQYHYRVEHDDSCQCFVIKKEK